MRKLLLGLIGLLFAMPGWATDLPAGYTELEYIQSTGTQYIDTGINPSSNLKIRLKTKTVTDNSSLFGAGTDSSNRTQLYLYSGTSSAEGITLRAWSNNTKFTTSYITNNIYDIIVDFKGKKVSIDGVETSFNYTITTNINYPIWLNANNLAGSAGGNIGNNGYYVVQMWDNNSLVLNLIPAKRNSDSVVGMYDTVSGTFFTNAGTGSFIAGPAVLNSCRNLFDMSDDNIELGKYIDNSGSILSADSNFYNKKHIPVVGGGTYTFSVSSGIRYASVMEYDASGTFIKRTLWGESTASSRFKQKTITLDSNTATVLIGSNVDAAGSTITLNRIHEINWQFELGSTATEYVPFCANQIKIATTAYNSARFSPVVTELNTTIATIRSVVTNTINQTKAIADLQATKQTRPDENCPAGKKCLLVEDNDGQPHWYEIIENAD